MYQMLPLNSSLVLLFDPHVAKKRYKDVTEVFLSILSWSYHDFKSLQSGVKKVGFGFSSSKKNLSECKENGFSKFFIMNNAKKIILKNNQLYIQSNENPTKFKLHERCN